MKKLKKWALLLFFVIILGGISATVSAANAAVWEAGYCYDGRGVVIQTDPYNKINGQYSIKITNTSFNDTCVQKRFNVKKNTMYRFSAMVKYSGFAANPEEGEYPSGASIGLSGSYDHSGYYNGNTWKRLEYTFYSGDREEVELCLRNGAFSLTCCGTAWFSDICLEEVQTTMSNEWSVLAVVFKNVDANLERDGKTLHCVDALDEIDVEYLAGVLDNLYTSFGDISGGQMRVSKIDVVSSDRLITKLNADGSLEPYNPEISQVLDEYLEKGDYHQVIAISPVTNVSTGWAGLGGGKYNGIYFCQTNYKSRNDYPGWFESFPDAIFVHEMLHCMEFESKRRSPEITAVLHDGLEYGFTDIRDEWRAWYTAYMRNLLPGGKGLDPSVYMVPYANGYSLADNDMAVDSRIGGASLVDDLYTVLEACFQSVTLSDQDFVAVDQDRDGRITVNDVYSLLKPCFKDSQGTVVSAGNGQYGLYMGCDRENIAAGDIINVVVYMDTLADITSFQFEMCFDPDKLQYQSGTAICIGEAATVENAYVYTAEDGIEKGRGVLQYAGVYADRSMPAVLNGKVAFAQFKVIDPEFEITIDGATNVYANIGGISMDITDNFVIHELTVTKPDESAYLH